MEQHIIENRLYLHTQDDQTILDTMDAEKKLRFEIVVNASEKSKTHLH